MNQVFLSNPSILMVATMVRYQREADNVQLETSLIAQFGTWMESRLGPLRRAIGMPLEEAAQRRIGLLCP